MIKKSKIKNNSDLLKIDAKKIQQELRRMSDPKKVSIYQSFFKTGPGQYGEGDIFIGVSVPSNRKVCRTNYLVSMNELEKLIRSKIHEDRLCALLILNEKIKKKIVQLSDANRFYLKNKIYVNNWDLVDSSAAYVLGPYIFEQMSIDKKNKQASAKEILNSQYGRILLELVNSENLWDRRIAILASFYFIRQGQFQLTMSLCEMLMNDDQDLMHKACGWMLREMGKKDVKSLKKFLDQFAHRMPRTMLRYSVERLEQKTKLKYMKQKAKKEY